MRLGMTGSRQPMHALSMRPSNPRKAGKSRRSWHLGVSLAEPKERHLLRLARKESLGSAVGAFGE